MVESLWPGRPRLWPHCGYQCSAGVCCALRKRAKVRVTAVCAQPAACRTCVWTHGIARQCANVSQMIQQTKSYPLPGHRLSSWRCTPWAHTAHSSHSTERLHAGEETRVRTSSLLYSTPRPSTGSRSEVTAAAFPATGSPPPRHLAADQATAAALVHTAALDDHTAARRSSRNRVFREG